jgi:Zn-dependent protease/CBS domain-containing protein
MVLFRFRGVPVKVGLSWLVIFALVFWSLGAGVFPSNYPGHPTWVYYTMSGVATVLFFASILVHELSHTMQSQREGVAVRDVTLWLFGGVSRAEEPLPGPGAEFRVVAAGPLASGALALLFWAMAVAGHGLGWPDPVVGVPSYLAWINALLLGFNVVPALPLDGGRLLHALLWWRTHDSARSTVVAARVGQGFAGLLIVAGIYLVFTTNSLSGIWFVLLGWFIGAAARQEAVGAQVTQAISGLRVRDLMAVAPVTVGSQATIDQFAGLLDRSTSHPVYPVVDDGRFTGLLLLRDAGRVPPHQRADVRVADLMLPAGGVPVVHPDDLVTDVVPVPGREPGRAVVLDADGGSVVVGVLSETDLSRALAISRFGSRR